ncbi:MAG TPA: hypothetical protein VEY95_05985 [Azospirillaceae bacterium]|nr:hypothetical protein [Azospirillaceae bacterium]
MTIPPVRNLTDPPTSLEERGRLDAALARLRERAVEQPVPKERPIGKNLIGAIRRGNGRRAMDLYETAERKRADVAPGEALPAEDRSPVAVMADIVRSETALLRSQTSDLLAYMARRDEALLGLLERVLGRQAPPPPTGTGIQALETRIERLCRQLESAKPAD